MKELKSISEYKKTNASFNKSSIEPSSKLNPVDERNKNKDKPLYPFHEVVQFRSEALPEGDIIIAPAPDVGAPSKTSWLSILASPISIALVMLVMVLVTGTIAVSYLMFTVPMAVVSITVSVINHFHQKNMFQKSQEEKASAYHAYLDECESKLEDIKQTQRRILNRENPSVANCLSFVAGNEELWSRSPRANNFMQIRLGVGSVPLCVSIKVPEKRYDQKNPMEEHAHTLAERYRHVPDVPKTLDLKNHLSVAITGERSAVISQAQALIVNATAMHSYEDLKLVVIYPREEQQQWQSIRWLPHIYDDQRASRMIATKPSDTKRLLTQLKEMVTNRTEEIANSHFRNHVAVPHYLIVIADMTSISAADIYALTVNNPSLAISTMFLSDKIPQGCQSVVEAVPGKSILYHVKTANKRDSFLADTISDKEFSDYCHRMAPIHIERKRASSEVPTFTSFFDLWNISSPEELPIGKNWKSFLPSVSMEVPIGISSEGVFHFNIHQHAHGPHGMYVGTTGSGKTSMVRSWILSMAAQFSPEHVNFVLVDFKGSSLLEDLQNLPHVVGTISSLDTDISRNLLALESEIKHRQAFFKDHGGDIYKCYEAGIRTIPFLFIVIDELNEFKLWANSCNLNQMKLLDRLSQVGRGLGIHLISGSQETTPFTNTMQQNARFRWCLKTAQKEDSRYLLQTEDGFNITTKGRAIMRVGNNEVYEELQPAYSDSKYISPEVRRAVPEQEMALMDLQGNKQKTMSREDLIKETQLQVVVSHIIQTALAHSKKAPRKIWPERLPDRLYLQDLSRMPEGSLSAAVGLVDDPVGQRQYPLQIDLKKTGHVVIYGAPQTGKTVFLLTAALSLMSHCSPEELSVYVLGDGEIEALKTCPHVRKTANSFAPSPVITAVHQELIRRKRGNAPSSDRTIVLLIDGFGQFVGEFRDMLVNIAQFGPGCNIHLVISAVNGNHVSSISYYLTGGYALWYTNTISSYRSDLLSQEINRIPPKDIPGRAIFHQGRTMEFQIALPYRNKEERDIILKDICAKYQNYAVDPEAPESLPNTVNLGLSPETECPVNQDFQADPSLLVLGNDVHQRNNLLTHIGSQLLKQPDVFKAVAIDIPPSHAAKLGGVISLHSGQEVDDFLQGMYEELGKRNQKYEADPTSTFPKYVFLTYDWANCISSASELSQLRFAKNCLLNGRRFGIQMVAGCSHEQYGYLFAEDTVGASQVLGIGCAILVDKQPDYLPPCFVDRMKSHSSSNGSFYISQQNSIEIQIPNADI